MPSRGEDKVDILLLDMWEHRIFFKSDIEENHQGTPDILFFFGQAQGLISCPCHVMATSWLLEVLRDKWWFWMWKVRENKHKGRKGGWNGGWEGEWDGEGALTYGVYMMLFVFSCQIDPHGMIPICSFAFCDSDGGWVPNWALKDKVTKTWFCDGVIKLVEGWRMRFSFKMIVPIWIERHRNWSSRNIARIKDNLSVSILAFWVFAYSLKCHLYLWMGIGHHTGPLVRTKVHLYKSKRSCKCWERWIFSHACPGGRVRIIKSISIMAGVLEGAWSNYKYTPEN